MSTETISPASRIYAEADPDRRKRLEVRTVRITMMLLTGIASLIHEYVLGTVFTYLLGSAVEQITVTIGVMFAAMWVGVLLQRRIQRGLAETFVALELILGLLGAFAPIILQWSFAELNTSFGLIKYAYMIIPGIAVGMEIPLIMRLNERFEKNLGSNIAQTWGWDYIGGAIGVIGWVILLRRLMPLYHISFLVGACNITVVLIAVWFFNRNGMFEFRISRYVYRVLAVASVAVMIFGFTNVQAWNAAVGQRLYDDPIAYAMTSKYQNIVLTKGPHPTNPSDNNWQLWLNGNKQFSSLDEAIYHEYLVHPAMNLAAARSRVLILGGGDGMALREVLKYDDVEEVTLVDLDAEMIEFARTHPVMTDLNQGAFSDARVSAAPAPITDTGETRNILMETDQTEQVDCNEVVTPEGARTSQCVAVPVTEQIATVSIFTIDADRFLSTPAEPWDVVIVDLPDPSSIELSKLYSVEFYTRVREVLSPDGIVVVQSTSPYHSKETFLCIIRSMSAAGLATVPYHDNVPSFGDWGWNLGSPSLTEAELYQRANELDTFGVETREVEASGLQRALIFNRGWLDSSNDRVSTLMEPLVFQLYVEEGWKVE